MIDLQQHEHAALGEIAGAGDQGVPLAKVGAAMAIRLGLEKFVTITKDTPQRVVITSKGAAFLRRTVFA